MSDILSRARVLAADSTYTEEMIAEFLGKYPTLDDDEAMLCLQLGSNQLLGELMRRLYTAGEVFRRLDDRGGLMNGRLESSRTA